MSSPANRLARESSPYLRQHAGNPVDWYPWGEEALERARAENRPILLSIGYSACHWCHVMAHESFEDPAAAAVMNRLFVNIKVDREERPDLDQIYQLAHQMLARRPGGWPLTMFLMPDGTPFFGGTYFPKVARQGMPAFPELCQRIAALYTEKKAQIATQNEAILDAFAQMEPDHAAPHSSLDDTPLIAALHGMKANFDPDDGGFGSAPKFPHVTDLDFCLRQHAASIAASGEVVDATAGDIDALNVVDVTLTHMAEGGIFDHVGGGFCRYSTDAHWGIPHFEKMLYDNGPLLGLYADAWAVSRKPLYVQVAEQTAGWLLREMRSPEGGFYSALDADSEHEEGKFYVWTPEAVRTLLTAEEYAVFAPHFGLDEPPNFENHHWHLRVSRPLQAVAGQLGLPLQQCAVLIKTARAKLFAAREQRVRPGLDDKVLTSWNALAVQGLARAGRVFGRDEWTDAAWKAFDFIRARMWRDGRLLAVYKDGRAHLNAYLDDYAFLLSAALELLQSRFDGEALVFAEALADVLLDQFADNERGGFFFTSRDHEKLIHRGKPGHDNATPSGNAVAAQALQRLSFITGEMRYAAAAERAVDLFYPRMAERPSGYATFLMALEEMLVPVRTIILRGPAEAMAGWQRALAGRYLPTTMVLAIPSTEHAAKSAEGGAAVLPSVLAKPAGAGVNAWVCEGVTCLAPIAALETLLKQLEGVQKA